MTEYQIDINEFKTWLETKNSDDVVGVIKLCRSCPVAIYLKETQKIANVFIFSWGMEVVEPVIKLKRKVTRFNHTPWVARFIEEIDSLDAAFTPVVAKQALEVLDKVEGDCDLLN